MTPVKSLRGELRPLLRVALPVVVAVALVCLAIINIVVVRTWRAEPEDGVLWAVEGGVNVVAEDVAAGSPAERASLRVRDVLLTIDGREVKSVQDVLASMHAAADGRPLTYVVTRAVGGTAGPDRAAADAGAAARPVLLAGARRHPRDHHRRVGATAAADRSGDAAFLLADGRVLRRARVHAERAVRPARLLLRLGRRWSRGSRCRRCSCTSRSCFRSGRSRGSTTRRWAASLLPLFYVPAFAPGRASRGR